MSRLERNLERKQRLSETGKSAIIGDKGEYCRRVICNIIEVVNGVTYNKYLHATKGWRTRRMK